jgi:hypothetical protein
MAKINYVSMNAGKNGIRLNYTRCTNEDSKGLTDSYNYKDEEIYFTGDPDEVAEKMAEVLKSTIIPGMMKEAGMTKEISMIKESIS